MQSLTASSTTEAEMVAISFAAREACHIQDMLHELGFGKYFIQQDQDRKRFHWSAITGDQHFLQCTHKACANPQVVLQRANCLWPSGSLYFFIQQRGRFIHERIEPRHLQAAIGAHPKLRQLKDDPHIISERQRDLGPHWASNLWTAAGYHQPDRWINI